MGKDGKYKGAHWETRREILRILKTEGELASAQLAGELGISSMAVRQHFNALEEAGDVVATDVSRGKVHRRKWRDGGRRGSLLDHLYVLTTPGAPAAGAR